MSVYKKTATKSKKDGATYVLGRDDDKDGHPLEEGGYYVAVVRSNYDGKVRGGIAKTLGVVKQKLSYAEAVALMNRCCGFKAFEAPKAP